jgi:hypothetical protein
LESEAKCDWPECTKPAKKGVLELEGHMWLALRFKGEDGSVETNDNPAIRFFGRQGMKMKSMRLCVEHTMFMAEDPSVFTEVLIEFLRRQLPPKQVKDARQTEELPD